MKLVLGWVALFLMVSTANATTPEYVELPPQPLSLLEISGSVGFGLPTGYLTTESSLSSYVFGVNLALPRGFMSFEWQNFNAYHDTGEFQLTNNKNVSVSSFAFIPYVRVYDKGLWNVNLGIGFINVGLSQDSPDNRVNYASFVWSGILKYQFNPRWSFHYRTQWYEVNQTVSDQETGFEIWSHMLGAAYRL